MKTEYKLSLEDQRLLHWLLDRSEQGIAIAKLEKAAGIPAFVLTRFLKGERKQLGEYREPLLQHLRTHFYYEIYEKSFDSGN